MPFASPNRARDGRTSNRELIVEDNNVRVANDSKIPLRFTAYQIDDFDSRSKMDKVSIETLTNGSDVMDFDSMPYLGLQSLDPSSDDFRASNHVQEPKAIWERLLSDQSNFYSKESLLRLGVAFSAGSVVANTKIDQQIQNHFQSSVRGAPSDEWFNFLHSSKELGNGVYTLPVFGAAWLANEYIDGPPEFETVGLWGERSMRGFLVGALPVVLLQNVTGGSRPDEVGLGSEWKPFRDNNGVSGHAFMSSLPFITAAKLTDNPWKKSFWYTASMIGPLSRVNDNHHYPSQIGLGWAMAYVAATAVQHTDDGRRGWSLVPESSLTSSGFAVQYRW